MESILEIFLLTTYISILRGINVSGQKKILMTDLKSLYEGLDFKAVTTYIQSGNVIFRTGFEVTAKDLADKIEAAIQKKYGFDVPVIIRTVDEMKATIQANPFLKTGGDIPEKLYITFLEEIPLIADIEKINHIDFYPDKFIIIGKEIFLDCAGGYGTTKLSNTFFEKKLKLNATTRNWKTVNTLVELAIKVDS